MSVIIATQEEVEQYYQDPGLNQSKLKLLSGNLSDFNKDFDSSAEHFLIGSAVDILLTSTEEEFNKKYYVSKIDKTPSEAVVEILKLAYHNLTEDYVKDLEVIQGQEQNNVPSFVDWLGPVEEYADQHGTYFINAANLLGWQPRWGVEAKLNNLLKEESLLYFVDLCYSTGKTIMSATQKKTIDDIVASLKTNPRTSSYFNREFFENLPEEVTVYYQFPIYFEYEGIKCKALLDILIVEKDKEGKILKITPIDVKTMHGNTYYFLSSLKTRRYDIQAAWYTLGLLDYFAVPEELISPFRFVVESSTNPGKPLVYELDSTLLELGLNGRQAIKLVDTNLFCKESLPTTTISYEILGIKQLLEKYKYHSENGFFIEKEIQEAGITPLVISWEGFVEIVKEEEKEWN
jgi:hypothetical protein